jgi:transposase
VGQTLDVRLTAETVEVLHKGHRVAVHPRRGPLRFSTLVDHMPRSHRAHREWSPGRFLHWAQDIGPCTRQVVQQQLESRPHPEHGYRACLGLLNLSRRYSRTRLEKACERALAIRSINYQSIASILKQGLDRQSLEGDAHLQDDLPLHDNVRGANYYH